MNLKHIFLSLPLIFLQLPLPSAPLLPASSTSPKIAINNRILAQVNGKSISVIDLMKKMDILFYREFPEYTSSAEARFQFYQANWKHMLQELIDKELILADAEENKLPVSSGDVRQEMETLFGPNIITNLDKIGMTFDEATKIILGDITIQRMLYIRVHGKAIRAVTPIEIRSFYQQYAQDNIQPKAWVYQVVSIRNKNTSEGAATANKAHTMLTQQQLPLTLLKEQLMSDKSQISISEEFRHKESEMSEVYRKTIATLSPLSYSSPLPQQSRATKETLFRIFYLKEILPGGAPPFASVENQLKNQLTEKIILEESKAYMTRLKDHFGVHEMIPENFTPFSLL